MASVTASILHGPRDIRLEPRPLPPLSPTDVLLSIKSTGLCGSDLHYFTHFRNGDILVREPLTLGHESAGIVTETGSAVTDLQVGDRVALEVGLPCGTCALCGEGRYNICREMKFRSSAKATPHAQGTLQERVVHPGKWCHRLPGEVSLDLGALVEPLSVAMHAHDRARLPAGSTVLIFGAGAVGLLCAAMSKVARAKRVVMADIQGERVDFAVRNGFADASVVVPMKRPETMEDKLLFAKEVAEMVKRVEVDGQAVGEVNAVFECTGVESCLQASIYVSCPTYYHFIALSGLTTLLGHGAGWKDHDHRHGQSHPNSTYIRSLPSRGGLGGCVPIRKHISPGYRASGQQEPLITRCEQVDHTEIHRHGEYPESL